VKNLGMKAGVTLNPHTDVRLLEDVVADVDMVLIMSVNPGFGGQTFIENSYRKISTLKEMIIQHNSSTLIEVDGGVTLDNAAKLVDCGVDVLVAGNTIFSHPNPPEAIKRLKMV
jgi:ribulose-phosphate 3-epimerase